MSPRVFFPNIKSIKAARLLQHFAIIYRQKLALGAKHCYSCACMRETWQEHSARWIFRWVHFWLTGVAFSKYHMWVKLKHQAIIGEDTAYNKANVTLNVEWLVIMIEIIFSTKYNFQGRDINNSIWRQTKKHSDL